MKSVDELTRTAARLREDFDQTFALPPDQPEQKLESLILIRLAGEIVALRMQAIKAIAKVKVIVPIPTEAEGLIGISAIRGALTPVYDLAGLMGLPAGAPPQGWVLLIAEPHLALAFDNLEGRAEVPLTCIYAEANESRREMARLDDGVHPLIDIQSLRERIRQQTAQASQRSKFK